MMVEPMLTLSCCKIIEEKAEVFCEIDVTLLAKGDEDSAMVEINNFFRYNGSYEVERKT